MKQLNVVDITISFYTSSYRRVAASATYYPVYTLSMQNWRMLTGLQIDIPRHSGKSHSMPATDKTTCSGSERKKSGSQRRHRLDLNCHLPWPGCKDLECGINQTDRPISTSPWFTSDAWLYSHWLAGAMMIFTRAFAQ